MINGQNMQKKQIIAKKTLVGHETEKIEVGCLKMSV